MVDNSWKLKMDFPLVGREEKSKERGLTMVLDKGLGYRETKDILELAEEYIDFWKLSFGTSFLYPRPLLMRKLNLLNSHQIETYPGGTALEIAVEKDCWEEYLDTAKELGFTAIEISDGTIDLDPNLRRRLVHRAAKLNFKVLTEVGKKDKEQGLKVAKIVKQLKKDLEEGADKVILEARESGKGISIYDQEGEVEEGKLKEVLLKIDNPYDIIWEAPLKKQQVYFIDKFGNNVNLGNIPPREILALESLRNGLRGDTFRSTLGGKKIKHDKELFVELDV